MIYADFNGSAPICNDVKNYLINRLETGPFANPNAIHHLGQKTLLGMENSRKFCADVLGASPEQLIFNSGATEGINQCFYSLLTPLLNTPKTKIYVSAIEHSAVLKCADYYKNSFGFEIIEIPTLTNGTIDVDYLSAELSKNKNQTAMVTTMAANNETGVIQPYIEISKLCQSYDISFFCDTTQLIGKEKFNFNDSGADFAVMSGHKIGALPGSGLILCKDRTKLLPFIIGGGQEKDLRGGTQNYLGNETLAVALNYFSQNLHKLENLKTQRENFEKKLKEKFSNISILGENSIRLAGTTCLSYPGIHGQAVQIELESQGIFVTTSSACSDNEPSTSKVLKSMKISDNVGRGVIRVSLGLCSKPESYDKILESLASAYEKLGQIKSY